MRARARELECACRRVRCRCRGADDAWRRVCRMFSLLSQTMLKNFNASTPISSLDSEVDAIMGDHSGKMHARDACARGRLRPGIASGQSWCVGCCAAVPT